jgi:hypothetical protein
MGCWPTPPGQLEVLLPPILPLWRQFCCHEHVLSFLRHLTLSLRRSGLRLPIPLLPHYGALMPSFAHVYPGGAYAKWATLPSTYQAITGDQPCLGFVVLVAPPLACGVIETLPSSWAWSYCHCAKDKYRITCHLAPHGDRILSWDKLDNCSPSRSPIVRTIVGLINW